jgi:geranylgeranyl diphosphate synthase type I
MPEASAALSERVDDVLSRYRDRVVAGMRAALDRPGIEHLRYARYHLGWDDANGNPIDAGAGKMLRPALCILCCEAVGGDAEDALPAAVAIELLHNFTLIHDDIEDGSEMRHGRPTLWRVAGVPQAINAGDGLFVVAQRTLLDLSLKPERVVEASQLLNDACVTLCEGQYADIGFETRGGVSLSDYEAMIGGKTAALLGASGAIGALAGGAKRDAVQAFLRCGMLLGMAFQAQDDVLGIWGDPAVTGKPVADDIRSRKKSMPVVLALDKLDEPSRAELQRLYAQPSLSEDDVQAVMRLLDRAKAGEAATLAATGYAREAVVAIAPLQVREERRADIEALAAFFVERSA